MILSDYHLNKNYFKNMFVPVSKPLLGKEEEEKVTDAIKSGNISSFQGGYIKEFEEKFAKFVGVKHAIAVSSGTAALHLAVIALELKEGDEIIVPTLTMMSSIFAPLYEKVKPIPIDIDEKTYNIDPNLIEQKITPKTKAIMVVHLYGHPVDMDPILNIAKKHNLYVIEDAAEAHGAKYKNKMVGGIGDIGCFSMYANKIITTGEGGMVTTNNDEYAEKIRNVKALSFGKEQKLMHQSIGYNYRLANLQAAIGVGQLEKVEKIISLKRMMGEFYLKNLADIKEIILPFEASYAFSVFWMFHIVLTGKLSGKRSEFIKMLKELGVETREDFVPYHEQKIFIEKGYVTRDECPLASRYAKDGLYLPSGTDITEEELRYVSEKVHEVVNKLLNN
jgi:perosamine synthetase